jgi:ribose/xylose/arabinose/galactoside ABC-type transport system permease subunit
MMYIADGATVWITGGKSITGIPESFINVYALKIGIVPLPVIILFLFGLITTVVIRRSYLGRWIYAVGINADAARVSGIPTESHIRCNRKIHSSYKKYK